jgi:cytosine deaminase
MPRTPEDTDIASAADFGRYFVRAPQAPAYVIANAHIPAPLTDEAAPANALLARDIVVANGKIAAIRPCGEGEYEAGLPVVDLRGGLALPRFVDVHTHLDKGHIWGRSPNPDGGFFGARQAVGEDRELRWNAKDVATRMDFALRCAFAHGTGALRTHIDSIGKQTAISWPVFEEMRQAWRGRIDLQAVSLCPVDLMVDDEPQFREIVRAVAHAGGALGGVSFLGRAPDEKLRAGLDLLFAAASANGLDIDLHVDESNSPDARSLEAIADAVLRHKFRGKVVAGHCCSLALAPDEDRARIISKVAEAGVAVVSLPMCNMYLQDRAPGRTPRWRGVAPLHELDAAGATVMVASDNTRDPFYAYGDLDMIEVFREATRILHFDHCERPWTRMLGRASAEVMGLPERGRLFAGGPADLVLLSARTLYELVARPQSDRVVLVAGQPVSTTLPDYRELDALQS